MIMFTRSSERSFNSMRYTGIRLGSDNDNIIDISKTGLGLGNSNIIGLGNGNNIGLGIGIGNNIGIGSGIGNNIGISLGNGNIIGFG